MNIFRLLYRDGFDWSAGSGNLSNWPVSLSYTIARPLAIGGGHKTGPGPVSNHRQKALNTGTADVRRLYATASIVSADRIVFNIKPVLSDRRARAVEGGNDYRLVVAVDFAKAILWIKWVGTHRDYDRIDVKEVEHGQ